MPTKPTTFPDAFVWDLDEHITSNLSGVSSVVRRPLRPTDNSKSVGIVGEEWEPVNRAYETGKSEPLLAQYAITIWCLVKHAREEEGIVEHGQQARNIRRMLVGDQLLLAQLRSNVDSYDTGMERVQRIHLQKQEFLSNELSGNYLFMSIARLMIETESV